MQQLIAHTSSSILWLQIGSINNTLTRVLLEEMAVALEEAESNPSVKSLVVTASGTQFFSPGLNLHEVSALSSSEMRRFMELFQEVCLRLVMFPKPAVAALNGDALAGGFLLASCCGSRVAADGIRVGLTPLTRLVGIPRLNEAILSCLLGPSTTRHLLAEGLSWTTAEARAHRWADRVVPLDQLESESKKLALKEPEKEDPKFESPLDLAPTALAHGLDRFVAHWSTPEVQREIKQAALRLALS